MSKTQFNNSSNIYDYEDDEDEGILSKTGSFVSSLFFKIANTINPFKSQKYVHNPYDINAANDPCNHLNYIDNLNRSQTNPIYFGNNNYEDYSNININNNIPQNQISNDNNDDYLTVQDLCNASPHLFDEIYKDIKRPPYIPNEEYFQKAKKYVYDNLVKKYKIIKPKFNDKIFGESVILLAVQLTNKYNIEKHYDYLVNNRSKCEYKLNIDVPEIIKNYYSNKAKVLFHEDILENSEKINQDINKELLSKFSYGLFNEKNIGNDINSNEKKIICRTPKTKRNYITFLLENKDYDSLLPNDRLRCQMYRECLLHRENELRNYARVVEVTNNMFKYICNQNEKLKEVIKEKEQKIEEFSKQIVLSRIKESEKDKQIEDYLKEINDLKNKQKNSFESLAKNDSIINQSKNIIAPINLSPNNNNDNINNNNIFTMKKPIESNNFFSFGNQNNSKSSEKTPAFNNSQSNSDFSKSKKKLNSNSFLVLNTHEINNSLIKEEEKENEEKQEPKLFGFLNSDDKKEENVNKTDEIKNEKNEEKNDKVNFGVINSNNSKTKLFNINNDNNDKKQEEQISNNNINNINLKSSINIFDTNKDNKNDNNTENKSVILFGFKNTENKNENDDKNKKEEEKKENAKQKENDKEKENQKLIKEIINEQKKEEENKPKEAIDNPFKINPPEKNEIKNEPKKEIKFEQIIPKETLNNPSNPFLSAVNIKTNEVFSVNSLNEVKEKQKTNDISDITSNRNTMDNTNPFISSNIDNSSFNITSNIIPDKKISNFQDNQFITGQNNNNNNLNEKQNQNPFILSNQNQNEINFNNNNNNNSSNNIFANNNINNNDKNMNDLSIFNNSNFNNNDINSVKNPFFIQSNKSLSQTNDNPFLTINNKNNDNGFTNNNNISMNQNPFLKIINNSETESFTNINKSNSNSQKNPFIQSITNAILNSSNNNNINTNNPFLAANNNFNASSNIDKSNPFLTSNNNLAPANTPIFGKNPFENNNNSSSNQNPLFNFQMNNQNDSNKVNPFLDNKNNGFNFMSNNSNNSFAMGVNMKKTGGNNYGSIFDDNKPRKTNGFFN